MSDGLDASHEVELVDYKLLEESPQAPSHNGLYITCTL